MTYQLGDILAPIFGVDFFRLTALVEIFDSQSLRVVANRFGESTSAQQVTLSQAEVDQRIVNLVPSWLIIWFTIWFTMVNGGFSMVYKFEPWFSLHHQPCDPVSCIASVSLACGSRTLNPTRNSTGNVANAWDPGGDTGGSQQSDLILSAYEWCGLWSHFSFKKHKKHIQCSGLGCEGGPGANSARVWA